MGCLNSRKEHIKAETVEGIEKQLEIEQAIFSEFIDKYKNTDSFTEAEELAIKLRISLQINLLEDQIDQFKKSKYYDLTEKNQEFIDIIKPTLGKYDQAKNEKFRVDDVEEFEREVNEFIIKSRELITEKEVI
jgi:hypothetical protein